MRHRPFLAGLFLATAAAAQEVGFTPDMGRVVATSAYGSIRAAEFYRDVACRFGREPRRTRALDQLIKVEIIRRELKASGLQVDEEQVRRKIAAQRALARAKGKSIDELLAKTGLDEETFRYYVRVGVAQGLLTAKALGCSPAAVTPSQEKLWYADVRRRHKVEKLLDNLEQGVAARVDGAIISTELYGWVLAAALRGSKKDYHLRVINSLLTSRRIRSLAEEAGLKVTRRDEELEVNRRRANVRRDPRFHGASLDQILKQTKGYTIEVLRRSRAFRSHILLGKLVAKAYPTAAQRAHLEKNRQAYLDHFGESRHLLHMAIPATDPAKAAKTIKNIRGRIKGARSFQLYAGLYSAGKDGRARKCDLGFVHRRQQGIPGPILDLAFTLGPNQLGGPIQTPKAFHLIMVTEVRPAPPDAELLVHVRRDLRERYLRKMIQDAGIKVLMK